MKLRLWIYHKIKPINQSPNQLMAISNTAVIGDHALVNERQIQDALKYIFLTLEWGIEYNRICTQYPAPKMPPYFVKNLNIF